MRRTTVDGAIKKSAMFELGFMSDILSDNPELSKEQASAWENVHESVKNLFIAFGCVDEYEAWYEKKLFDSEAMDKFGIVRFED